MIGMARKCELQTALAGNSIDDSQRPTGILQHRTLLNVELQIAQDLAIDSSICNFCWIQTKISNRLTYRNALPILPAQHFLIKAAHERAAADKRRAKANTLLFGKCDDFDSKGDRKSTRLNSSHLGI